jgi:hypothetical protein
MFSSIVRAVRPLAIASAALALTAAPLLAQVSSPSVVPSRILAPVDESARVMLHGYVSSLANAANDRGVAPDSMPLERVHLVLKHSAAQQAALDQFLADAHNPASPNYHKWLTPTQFGQQFGPSDQDIATVESWLSAHGFNVAGVKPGKQVIEFTGSVAQLRDAFQTQIHQYQVNGHTRYGAANNPTVPAALAPVVGGFVSLNDFHPQTGARVLGTASYNPKTGQAAPNWTYGNSSGISFVLAPQDFGVEYDLPNSTLNSSFSGTNLDGTGQSIAILDFSNINVALVNQFRTMFGLPANPPNVIVDGNDPGIDGINNPGGEEYGTSVESYLDVEWAGAAAPKATIDLVIASDTALEAGGFLAAERAVYSNVAPIISASIDLGGCEQTSGSANSFIDSLWQQAAAQGITVVVAAGDSGSAGCDSSSLPYASNGLGVNNWASTPYDISVGGTDFYYSSYAGGTSAVNTQLATYWNTTASQTPSASIKGYIPEQPWNDSQYGLDITNYFTAEGTTTVAAGSGGASSSAVCAAGYSTSNGACLGSLTGYPKPSWQAGVSGIPADGVRDTPDVSLFAADGLNASFYPICAQDGDCQTPSGSSLYQITGVGGTSAAAPSFAAILALVNEKYGPQGQANFILYPLKAAASAAFHDITVGTNAVPCYPIGGTNTNCIAAANPVTIQVQNSSGQTVPLTEGEMGTGSTADYKTAAGYNLATGLGSVDAAQLISNWGSVAANEKVTTTTLTPSSTSFVHGTAITISGSVTGTTGTPTGSVALMTDSTLTAQQGQTNFPLGTNASFSSSTVNYLPGGTYNIWGQYSGDGTNAPSTSAKTPITVAQEASTLAFELLNAASLSAKSGLASGTTVPFGTQILLAAQAYGSTYYTTCVAPTPPPTTCQGYTNPTGVVTFSDGGSAINAAVLNAEGDAEFNAPLGVGPHTLTASYAGDSSYQAATGSSFTLTVAKNTPLILLGVPYEVQTTTQSGLAAGQADILTIVVMNSSNATTASSSGLAALAGFPETVAVAPPTGTLTLSGGPSGTPTSATLAAGVDPTTGAPVGIATITIPSTSTGFTLSVTYSGDGNYNSVADTGSSGGFSIPYLASGGTASATTANLSGTTISPTTSITLSGTVTGASGKAAPTGYVEIYAGGYILNYVQLTASTASLAQPFRRLNLYTTGGGALLACVLLLAIPARRRAWRNFLALVVIACIAGFDIGCGGGSSSSGSGGSGSSGGGGTGAAPFANFTTTLNSQALLQGSNTITVEYIGDSTYGPSSYTITNPLSNPLSDFALTAAAAIVPTPLGSSGQTAVYATPTNGFAGAVSLTCSVSGPASGVTCSVSPTSVNLTAGGTSQTVTLNVGAGAAATAGNYTITVTGSNSSGNQVHTLGVTAVVP